MPIIIEEKEKFNKIKRRKLCLDPIWYLIKKIIWQRLMNKMRRIKRKSRKNSMGILKLEENSMNYSFIKVEDKLKHRLVRREDFLVMSHWLLQSDWHYISMNVTFSSVRLFYTDEEKKWIVYMMISNVLVLSSLTRTCIEHTNSLGSFVFQRWTNKKISFMLTVVDNRKKNEWTDEKKFQWWIRITSFIRFKCFVWITELIRFDFLQCNEEKRCNGDRSRTIEMCPFFFFLS